jgi:hypothetical protein
VQHVTKLLLLYNGNLGSSNLTVGWKKLIDGMLKPNVG